MASAPRKAPFGVVIPAHNEEVVIESSLKTLTMLVSSEDVYVVSDGSKDKTAKLARKFTKNVLALSRNQGKAEALARLIKKYRLTERYDYLLFSDADSQLSAGFLDRVKAHMAARPACIVGAVTSQRHGLISAYRVFEYALSTHLFKRAQASLNIILVAPGCSSAYRSDVLDQLIFSHRTVTEDLDLTLQIHLNKLGAIVFVPRAKVITQDPENFIGYWHQILRWNSGYWQNFFLHRLYKPTRLLSAEAWLFIIDAISWVVAVAVGVTHPILLTKLLVFSYLGILVLSAGLICWERKWWALRFVPVFPFFQLVGVAAYFFAFFRVLFSKNALSWNKPSRYHIP